MGIKLLILLALVIGVLYSIHLLVQDYQAVTAPRLLKLLFRSQRDLQPRTKMKAHVRWKMILRHDPLECARVIFCHLGATRNHTEVQRGFVYMLSLDPQDEDRSAREEFTKAYSGGLTFREPVQCRQHYPHCPFDASILFQLVGFLIKNPMFKEPSLSLASEEKIR